MSDVWMSDACGCMQWLHASVGVLTQSRRHHQFCRQWRLAASSLCCLLGTGISHLSVHCAVCCSMVAYLSLHSLGSTENVGAKNTVTFSELTALKIHRLSTTTTPCWCSTQPHCCSSMSVVLPTQWTFTSLHVNFLGTIHNVQKQSGLIAPRQLVCHMASAAAACYTIQNRFVMHRLVQTKQVAQLFLGVADRTAP